MWVVRVGAVRADMSCRIAGPRVQVRGRTQLSASIGVHVISFHFVVLVVEVHEILQARVRSVSIGPHHCPILPK